MFKPGKNYCELGAQNSEQRSAIERDKAAALLASKVNRGRLPEREARRMVAERFSEPHKRKDILDRLTKYIRSI